MENIVYVKGEWVPQSQAKVSILDHGLLYGDGVFEGIRAYNGRIFKLEKHVDRLFLSAKALDIQIGKSKVEMAELILEACRKNNIETGYIRPLVTRGEGDLGLDPRKCKKGASVIIIAVPQLSLYGDAYERGLSVVTASHRRVPPQSLSPSIKSLNYLNNVLARIEANATNADEALMLDLQGYVSEASADNLFIVNRKALTTPPTSTNLPGITRDTVMELATKKGYQVREQFFSLFDVWTADECFITGTAAEVGPVSKVDGRMIGEGKPGPITRELMKAYRELVMSTGTPIRK